LAVGQIKAEVVEIDHDIEDLLPGFARNRLSDVGSIDAALRDGALENARELAHRIKGVGSSYGFDDITEHGAALEAACSSGSGEAARSALDALRTYLRDVRVLFQGAALSFEELAER